MASIVRYVFDTAAPSYTCPLSRRGPLTALIFNVRSVFIMCVFLWFWPFFFVFCFFLFADTIVYTTLFLLEATKKIKNIYIIIIIYNYIYVYTVA